jgi:hypothetical protein
MNTNRARPLFALFILLILLSVFCHSSFGENPLQPGFSKLKNLVGEWRGTLPDGKPIDISYQEINGGAILELYRSSDPMWWNMSSVYHLDVNKIIMSHYCSWGNHPRMFTTVGSEKTDQLNFSFLDMAMTAPHHGYMQTSSIHFEDDDHFSHHWVWRENGQSTPLVVRMTRKTEQSLTYK